MREEYTVSDYLHQKHTDPVACTVCNKLFLPEAPGLSFCSIDCYEQSRSKSKNKSKHLKYKRNEARTKPIKATLEPVIQDDPVDDDEMWAARAKYWEGEQSNTSSTFEYKRRKPIEERKPLVLTGHGVQLKIDHGTLLVRDGFTHYPQTRKEWRFFPGEWRLPSRIFLLDTDGSITLPVINWLSEQNVPLIMINYRGQVQSVIGGNGIVSDLKLRQAQIDAQSNGVGLEIATHLIREKITACKKTLKIFSSPKAQRAIQKLDKHSKELKYPIKDQKSLLIIEARAAADYFDVWYTLPIKWKDTDKHPIPDDWRFAGRRKSFYGMSNRNATDPLNAMLNYAYAVLESQVLIVILSAGLDPTIGYLHSCQPLGRKALVYDLMEPLRPIADHQVLKLLSNQVFNRNDFLLSPRGICRLNPRLASKIVEPLMCERLWCNLRIRLMPEYFLANLLK
jgi:CRISPR-associated endonuclease Cas1